MITDLTGFLHLVCGGFPDSVRECAPPPSKLKKAYTTNRKSIGVQMKKAYPLASEYAFFVGIPVFVRFKTKKAYPSSVGYALFMEPLSIFGS